MGWFGIEGMGEVGERVGVHVAVGEEFVGVEDEIPVAGAIAAEKEFLPGDFVACERLSGAEDVDTGVGTGDVECGVGGAVIDKNDAGDAEIEVVAQEGGEAEGFVANDRKEPYLAEGAGRGLGGEPMEAGCGDEAAPETVEADFETFEIHAGRARDQNSGSTSRWSMMNWRRSGVLRPM